jgi:RimJ/RimL family protein N-acetyltransferase
VTVLAVRPFVDRDDYVAMVDYFHTADDAFLAGMGVDRAKLPAKDEWLARLAADHERADACKERAWVAWLADGARVGHSSIDTIAIGESARIHLHLWDARLRRAGLGAQLFARSIDHVVRRFQLRRVVCEPWAGNPAPNRTLVRLGFTFVRTYRTVPGAINREQDVNRYELEL